jgi:hypothetical protein
MMRLLGDGRVVIPESLRVQILGIIRNCLAVVDSINAVLKKYEGRAGAERWAAFRKGEVAGLKMSFKVHWGLLHLILELVSVSVLKGILDNVDVVRTGVYDIK